MPLPLKPAEARLRIIALRRLAADAIDSAAAAALAADDRLAAIHDRQAATFAAEAARLAVRALTAARDL